MMGKFFGKRYWYPTPNDGTVQIGVCRGLGETWLVGYQRPGSTSTRRIKTPKLPVLMNPEPLQSILDEWATQRRLREVE